MKEKQNYFEINNLNEYITCITKNNLGECISRGENSKFDRITSSAFRYKSPIRFQNLTNIFYDEIGNTITNMQRENFVAFAQHHGIPTNLVDFSKSPLVSLFFACYDPYSITDNSGYVYFINSDRLIDITEFLKYPNNHTNIFQNLIHLKPSVSPLILQLYKYEHKHIQEIESTVIEWIDKLKIYSNVKEKYKKVFTIVNDYNKDSKKPYNPELCEYTRKLSDALIQSNHDDEGTLTDFIIWHDYIDEYNSLLKEMSEFPQYTYFEDLFLLLLVIRVVFGELFDCSAYNKKAFDTFHFPFYFTYSPPNVLSRIENQSSLFIYQLFYDDYMADPYIDGIKNRATQNILPDYTIKINNKKEILRSLDSLGINLKYIYKDYDNIARYIKSKNPEA